MKVVVCPICSCEFFTVIFSNAVDRMHGIGGDSGSFRYVKCGHCGHLYLNPRPDSEALKNFYPKEYKLHNPAGVNSGSILTKFISPVKRMERRLKAILTPETNILDIGCGRGDFLAYIRDTYDCNCYGIDFNSHAVDTAKLLHHLDVFHGQIAKAPFIDRQFDLITMWWYLEHDPEPLSTLVRCRDLLKDNGILVFAVPNFRSLNAWIFKSRWFHLDAPRHVSIFSPTSVRRLLNETGFILRSVEYDATTWGITGSLQYTLYGRGYNIPFEFSGNSLVRLIVFPLTFLLSVLGFSDIMIVYAEKPFQ